MIVITSLKLCLLPIKPILKWVIVFEVIIAIFGDKIYEHCARGVETQVENVAFSVEE